MSQDVGIGRATLGETKSAKISINPRLRERGSRTRTGYQGLALTRLGTSLGVRGTQVQVCESWVGVFFMPRSCTVCGDMIRHGMTSPLRV